MLWAVIMAGGYGTRFWPESRRKNPKQFLRFFGRKTMLEETILRLGRSIAPERIFVVTQKDKVPLVRRVLKGLRPGRIVGEPAGRNTAPCAVLAAALALKKDPDAVIALLPADHRIEKPVAFRRALQAASQTARTSGLPVTFGIRPGFPHTGYGYLEVSGLAFRRSGFAVYRLKCFHEKPDQRKAERFCRSRRFLWNSGMFVWRADAVMKAARQYLPKVHECAVRIAEDFPSRFPKLFPKMPDISIDYGLMEKLKGRILTMPVDFGWNDVGGWQSLLDLCPKDGEGNVRSGNTLLIESRGNIVRAGGRLVALVGVEDHVVVDTPDALLICPRAKTESIRRVVEALHAKKLKQYI